MTRGIVTGALLVFLAATLACAAEPASSSSAQRNYVRRAQAQIDSLDKGIHRAERHLRQVDAAMRNECEETLKNLRRKERLARIQLNGIRHAARDHWPAMRAKEDALLIRLQNSYQHLVNRYFK